MDLEQVFAVLGLLLIAFWRGDGKEGIFMYCMAGAASMAMGLAWRDTYDSGFGITLSIVYLGAGLYCIILAISNVIEKITRR